MAYYQSYPLSGNAPRALEIMRNYFIYNGFELTELTSTGFKARRPPRSQGLHSQHNPLAMVREVSVESLGQSLTVEAKTGPANKVWGMLAMVISIITGIIVSLAIVDSHGAKQQPIPWPVVLGAPLFIGVIVAGIFVSMNKVAKRLIDVAASNAVMVAEREAMGGRR